MVTPVDDRRIDLPVDTATGVLGQLLERLEPKGRDSCGH